MAAVAGLRAIRTAGIEPDDIDLILLGTLTPDYWMPSTAALVKEAIGNSKAAAFDVAAACSGFVYAFATAQAYILAGLAKHVLVIGAELLTRFLDYTDRSTCILFGDGAGAVVLSASEEPGGALGVEMTTEPRGAYMIWLPAGGAKSPSSAETIARGEHYIRMEGKETYRFATKTLASTALESIRKSGLDPSDIDLFIPHQANIRIIEAVAKGLDLPMEKMFVNLDRYGNTSAASIPIALAEAVDSGRVKVGDHVVIVAFGAGFTSGAVAIEWTADPARAVGVDARQAVAAHVGDQFGADNQHLISRAFGWFYMAVNVGSSISIWVIPILLAKYGAGPAFILPAALMLLATFVFWSGRNKFAHIPPAGTAYLRKIFSPGNLKILGGLAMIFVFMVPFWALWDQCSSEWVGQATKVEIANGDVKPGGYGYFWWIRPNGAYEAVGIFGQSVTTFPAERLIVVQNAAWPAATGKALSAARTAMIEGVRKAAR